MPLFVQTKQEDDLVLGVVNGPIVHVHVPSVARRPLDEPQILFFDLSTRFGISG